MPKSPRHVLGDDSDAEELLCIVDTVFEDTTLTVYREKNGLDDCRILAIEDDEARLVLPLGGAEVQKLIAALQKPR